MKNKRDLRRVLTAAAVTAIFAAAPAAAAPLTGTFSVSGAFLPMFDGTTLADLMTANALDFTNGSTPSPGTPGPITVTQASGDFATLIPVGTTGTVEDFAFGGNPFPGFPTPPITNFEQIGSPPLVTVDLLNIHLISQSDAFLNLQGSTVVRSSQFNATPGSYSFSGRVGDAGSSRFSFLAANDIPEPLSLALVGIALVSVSLARRKSS